MRGDSIGRNPSMLILTMLSFLVGVVVGLRFKVFILIPTIGLALAIVAVSGVGVGDGAWQLIGTMVVVATFIQLGYLGGSVFQSVSRGTRAAGLNGEPIRNYRGNSVRPIAQSWGSIQSVRNEQAVAPGVSRSVGPYSSVGLGTSRRSIPERDYSSTADRAHGRIIFSWEEILNISVPPQRE